MLRGVADRSVASQNKDELHQLLEVLNQKERKIILEIGVHRGHSMQTWSEAFGPDLMLGIETEPEHIEYMEKLMTIIPLDSTSPQALDMVTKILDGRELDFLFIDGNHLYDYVKSDWEMYSPLVAKGGIVAFHDIKIHENDTVEVSEFWEEIKDEHPYMEISWPMPGQPGNRDSGVGIIFR